MAASMSTPIRVAHVGGADLTMRFLLLAQLQRLRDEGFEVATISAPGPWAGDLEREGIRHIPWAELTRAWDPVADLRALRALVRILRRERFDLVHTHNPKAGVIARVAARLARVPCVVNTVHGLYATREDPFLKRIPVLTLERLVARLSDLELYQSEEDLERARRVRVVSAAKSALLGNGTDLARFDPSRVPPERVARLRRELGIPEEALVVGTIGRLVAEKGYREFFAAARALTAPGVRFLAVGPVDPEKGDALGEEEIRRAGEDVIFGGWRDDVPELLALMDVFVLPSWREGVPRSAIEAAAMGKPLVLTDIRGCREVAREGVEGLLVPPGDAERLTEAIARLLADAELRERLGSAARERARERFDERGVADRVVAHYRELLERRGLLRPAEGPVRVRPARPADAPVLARLHREALPEAFLPALGERFLRRLYRALSADRGAVTLVAEDGRGVVGMVAGAVSVGAFYRRFSVRHGLPAGLAAAPRLLRPGTLRRLRETSRYPQAARVLPEAELLSIAVEPGWRSAGVGRALAEALLRDLARRGAREVKVVVGADNEAANRFYERMGFRPAGRIDVHRGTPSNVWVVTCNSSWRSGSPSS